MINNLIIEQNNSVIKFTNCDLIEIIYNISKSMNESDNQYLKGLLQTDYAYKDAVDFLNQKFIDFHINVNNDYYIRFKDDNVRILLTNQFSSNGHLTIEQAASVNNHSTFKTLFGGNSQITSFDELKYFTNIKTLGWDTFNGCTNLESIDLQNINSVEQNAFKDCKKLTSIKNYQNVQKWDVGIFNNCNLTGDYDFSNSLSNNNERRILGFNNNKNLTSVIMPTGVKYLCQFSGCTSLHTVSNTDDIINIEYETFSNCTSLKNISLPNVTYIGQNAFKNCGLESISLPLLTNINFSGAFSNCASLTTISLPELKSITTAQTFNGCPSLTYISLPNLETLSGQTNFGTSFIEIDVPKLSGVIGDYAFAGCENLTTLNIDWENITKINNSAFRLCKKLFNNMTLNLPACTVIESNPFEQCTIDTLKLPVIEYINGRFINTTINHLELNPNINSLPDNFLWGNKGYDVTGLYNLTEVPTHVFYQNSNLTALDFSNKLKIIHDNAFGECKKLVHLMKDNQILKPTYVDHDAFRDCSLLEDTIDISDCTYIGNYAFSGSPNLNIIGTFNINLTSIGNYAFTRCSRTGNIDIPENITQIGICAFQYMSNLTSMTFISTTPPSVYDNSFYNTSFIIKVPQAALETYKSAPGFSSHTSRIVGY